MKMNMMSGAKLRLTLGFMLVLFCTPMGHASGHADESTSTFEDTIRWLSDKGQEYGTFQPRLGEELPPVETQFTVTDKCALNVTITGGCGYGRPFDRHLYRIPLSKIVPSASSIEPVLPVGAIDEYLVLLRSAGEGQGAFLMKTMNETMSAWTPLQEIRLCTKTRQQADQLRWHLNQAALLCGATLAP
jgi:hypothetical protein